MADQGTGSDRKERQAVAGVLDPDEISRQGRLIRQYGYEDEIAYLRNEANRDADREWFLEQEKEDGESTIL